MKLLILIITLFSAGVFAQIEKNNEICGELAYSQGAYVLMSDHGGDYFVREEKLSSESMHLTRVMRIIVQNHNYEESDFPQACFYDVKSERA